MGSLGGWEIVIILGVLVLLFGARKLPDMARSIGQSARVFKGEMKGLREDGKDGKDTSDGSAPVAAPAPLPPVQQNAAVPNAAVPNAAVPNAAAPNGAQPNGAQPGNAQPVQQPTQAPGATPGQ